MRIDCGMQTIVYSLFMPFAYVINTYIHMYMHDEQALGWLPQYRLRLVIEDKLSELPIHY